MIECCRRTKPPHQRLSFPPKTIREVCPGLAGTRQLTYLACPHLPQLQVESNLALVAVRRQQAANCLAASPTIPHPRARETICRHLHEIPHQHRPSPLTRQGPRNGPEKNHRKTRITNGVDPVTLVYPLNLDTVPSLVTTSGSLTLIVLGARATGTIATATETGRGREGEVL